MAWHQTQASKCHRPAINKVGVWEKGAHSMSETAHTRKSPVQNLSHHIHLNIRWPPSIVFNLSGICLLHRTCLPLCRIKGNHTFSSWWSKKKFLSYIGVNS